MGKPKSKCHRCEYSFPDHRPAEKERLADIQHYCDYIGIQGHSRPCPPGAACTVFKPRTGTPPPAPVAEPTAKLETEAPPCRKGTPRLPPEAIDRARELLLDGEDACTVADQTGISRATAYKLRTKLLAAGKLAAPDRDRQQYAVRTIWPKKEVFRGNVKACAAFLGVTESYVKTAIYKKLVVQKTYTVVRAQDNKS